MPISNELLVAVHTSKFWAHYVFDEEPDSLYAENREVDYAVILPVAKGYAIKLSFDSSFLIFELGFLHPNGSSELGWDDQAHWHPHVLRWEELEVISRAASKLDPTLPHPGFPLLLLQRFAPICTDHNIDHVFQLLKAAWQSLNIYNDDQIQSQLVWYDFRRAGFIWQKSEFGDWTIHQSEDDSERSGMDLYSTRVAENENFAHRQWNELVAAATKTAQR